MNILDRCQDWLADRISWVQYPNITSAANKERFRVKFKHPMSWQARMGLLLYGMVVLFLAGGLLTVMVVVLIYVVTAN